MGEWIHCNKCLQRFNPKLKFSVHECGHVECQNCIGVDQAEGKCTTCGKISKGITLSTEMKPDILKFFKPLTQQLDQIKQVIEYQQGQRMNLCNKLAIKYSQAKKEIIKLYKVIENLKRDNDNLRKDNAKMKKEVPMFKGNDSSSAHGKKYITSTPNCAGMAFDSPAVVNESISTIGNNFTISTNASTPLGSINSREVLMRPGYARRTDLLLQPNSLHKYPQLMSGSSVKVISPPDNVSTRRGWRQTPSMYSPIMSLVNYPLLRQTHL